MKLGRLNRHCERSEAIQSGARIALDYRGDCVASQ